jgi:hypothetical protein
MKASLTTAVLAASVATVSPAQAAAIEELAGTWTLEAADLIRTDGSVIRDYGDAPKGRLIIDPSGRYSLQIFKYERPRFASADKAAATAAEFRSAVLGSSTHYGQLRMEAGQLAFHIEGASFPNWEGSVQQREYELKDGVLRYLVPARADGNVPVSVWRRVSR